MTRSIKCQYLYDKDAFATLYEKDGKSFTCVDYDCAYHGKAYKLEGVAKVLESSDSPYEGSTYWTKHGDSFLAISRSGTVYVGKCYHKPNRFGMLPWYSPSFSELVKLV